jgi:hypothetical protein
LESVLEASRERKDIRRRFAKLLKGKRRAFPSLREPLDVPSRHGVYIVYGPRNAILHVGRTVRAQRGLWQRLTEHLRSNSSFMASRFERDGSKLRGKCSYVYTVVKNDRTRALLESYAVGYLCPKHLGLGRLLGKRR